MKVFQQASLEIVRQKHSRNCRVSTKKFKKYDTKLNSKLLAKEYQSHNVFHQSIQDYEKEISKIPKINLFNRFISKTKKFSNHQRKSTSFEIGMMKERANLRKRKQGSSRILQSSHKREKLNKKTDKQKTKNKRNVLDKLFKSKRKTKKKLKSNQLLKEQKVIKIDSKNKKIRQNFSIANLQQNGKIIKKKKKKLHLTKQKLSLKKVFEEERDNFIDFQPLFKNEQFLFKFIEAFHNKTDFYDLFKSYIDFHQQNNYQQYINLIKINMQLVYKNSIILERAVFMISFYLLIKKKFDNEQLFLKKLILGVYSNYCNFIQKLYDSNKYGQTHQFKTFFKSFEQRNLKKYNFKLKSSNKKHNQKIIKYIQFDVSFFDKYFSNQLNKLCQFIDDFSLQEGFQFLIQNFQTLYNQKGVTQQKSESYFGMEKIIENSSERSSSVNSDHKKEYVLVLDLDETLVHYTECNGEGRVNFRPFVDLFLKEMNKNFEIMIFTAALKDYADTILNHFDPDGCLFSKRFYRKDTLFQDNEYSIKDLDKLKRDLKKVIIIDNIPDNFKNQPDNGIFINSWYDDPKDTALKDLIPILKEVVNSSTPDVRDYLKNYKKKLIEKIQRGSLNPFVHLKNDKFD